MRCARNKWRLAWAFIGLFCKRALAPVDPSVRPKVRPVQIVCAVGDGLSLKPLFAPVCDSVSIAVGQLPDARWSSDVERSVKPHYALGKGHFVGEHNAFVEPAVAICVLQAHNTMGFLPRLPFDVVVRP